MVNAKQNITELIGKTPLLKLNQIVPEGAADVYVKLEFFNPGSSIKDRIALAMIDAAEKSGKLTAGGTIIEPTSGNTGIGLALTAAAKGYHLIITMPKSMSIERRKLIQGYGAELILVDGGMPDAIKTAKDLAEKNDYFLPLQFDNPANPAIHEKTTGQEIIADFAGRTPDAFVAGVGTGGTLTGVGHALKKVNPQVEIYALEAAGSPFLKNGKAGKHKIQGISAGFVPAVLDTDLYTDIIEVTDEQAITTAQKVSYQEGFLPGISAGANIYGAIEIAKKLGRGKSVVTVVPDNGERYLSTDLFNF
ncbi:MAG: cysteine synthase A [Liquorilactobacillus nagelii]|jgi:cysteine synthase A|uniref:Cysteine synthase n=1 Tax=Liquorilactobacillus nagelii TaxID=82688 RepID=A0A3S6R2P7_9LACO|nr:cysteine synthase A [Liquorilactobacillus nagelii]AUJ32937.1 cysteine synthase A [Liquorilactobacillus nagelii]MCC7616311.1 cysteine synthase A [Liquorilactobacillus nagelii]MCI1700875.1 cysteine synthase A [Liquorilactobacillus nagelii]MCP9315072.1 cysteine synthase A [Liquorilactobacillus nagelii]ULQ48570.1 cysteine synthase A [Liquorilactobacillus nagelii]